MPLVDAGAGGSLLQRVGAVRRQIAAELGTVIPSVRIHDEIGLASHEYVLKVRGTEVARGRTMAGHQLALDPGDAVGQLQGVPDDRARVRPARALDRRRRRAPRPRRSGTPSSTRSR